MMSHPCRGCPMSILDNKIICERCRARLSDNARSQLRTLFTGTGQNYISVLHTIDHELVGTP